MAEFAALPLFTDALPTTFDPNEWLTPDTYGRNYSKLTTKSGIYLFCLTDVDAVPVKNQVLYVGMSVNIAARCAGHEIKRLLPPGFIRTFFRHHSENLREVERHFIHAFNPPYNIIGRPRGLQ